MFGQAPPPNGEITNALPPPCNDNAELQRLLIAIGYKLQVTGKIDEDTALALLTYASVKGLLSVERDTSRELCDALVADAAKRGGAKKRQYAMVGVGALLLAGVVGVVAYSYGKRRR